jgi:hypothetical protein
MEARLHNGWLPTGAWNRWRKCPKGCSIDRMAVRRGESESTPDEQPEPLRKAPPPNLQQHVARLVATAPPLSAEQQQRLRCLLNAGHGHGEGSESAAAA